MKSIAGLVLGMLLLTACPPQQPLQDTARDAVATAKGYLDSAKQKHPECVLDPSGVECKIIGRGVGAKDAVIDALNLYCASPDYDAGAICTPNKDAQSKLQRALQDMNKIMGDVKAAAGIQ